MPFVFTTSSNRYILVYIVLIFIGCKSDTVELDEDMRKISPEALEYFYFQPGSHWHYINDKTGDRDTQTVLSTKRKWFMSSANLGYEVVSTTLFSTFENQTIDYDAIWEGCSKQDRDNGIKECCWLKTGKPSEGYFSTWSYPFVIGRSGVSAFSQGDSSIYTVTELHDSLKLNNTMFYKVVKIKTTNARFYFHQDINMYWAKGVGVVKKEDLTKGETWLLIDYKIVK